MSAINTDPDEILVVDDTPANLKLLADILTNAGYRVRLAGDGELALRSARTRPPALVLLDIRMPDMDGYEVCQRLKEHELTRSVPIIFLSILEDEHEKMRAFEVGGVDYINKPIRAAEVLARVTTHLALRHAQLDLETRNAELEAARDTLEERVKERSAELEQTNQRLQQALDVNSHTLEALRISELNYRRIVDTAIEGIWGLGPDAMTTFANGRMAEMLGYPQEEMIDRPTTDFMFEEDVSGQHDRIENLRHGLSENFECRFRRKNGETVWTHVSAAPILDDERHFQGSFAMFTDITERKQAEEEKRKLQDQLAQARKMESIGRLAGGVAHDFNNMLGVILGNAELALKEMGPAHPLFINLEEVRKAAERSADLTRQLLAFARRQTIIPEVLDLNETVSKMLIMLRRLVGEDIDLVWVPGRDLWQVRIDPAQVDQILANLCVNARDAIAGIGRITIETGTVSFDEAYFTDQQEFTPGDFLMLAISDDGHGMDRETLGKIFEPFFTTKGIGRGTGLGLATVYGIVKQNNGFINVYSEPDSGTVFRIYLPRHAAGAGGIRKDKAVTPVARGSETILLVEDEPAILNLAKIMLESFGYGVFPASTPGEALILAREHAGEIHLLIADVIMPEMNGRELARNLTSFCPGLRRLFMSGYTADVIAHRGVLDEGVNFLQKPFSMQALATKVREALDGE